MKIMIWKIVFSGLQKENTQGKNSSFGMLQAQRILGGMLQSLFILTNTILLILYQYRCSVKSTFFIQGNSFHLPWADRCSHIPWARGLSGIVPYYTLDHHTTVSSNNPLIRNQFRASVTDLRLALGERWVKSTACRSIVKLKKWKETKHGTEQVGWNWN